MSACRAGRSPATLPHVRLEALLQRRAVRRAATPAGRRTWARAGVAWPGGVLGQHSWRCWSCRWWHDPLPGRRLPALRAPTPDRRLRCLPAVPGAGPHGPRTRPGRSTSIAGNQYGQQLFLANMRFQRPRTPRLGPPTPQQANGQAMPARVQAAGLAATGPVRPSAPTPS